MYDISIVIPGIRTEHWGRIFAEIEGAIGKYKFEVIAVGPNFPPVELQNRLEFRYVQDYGSPSRAFQIGASLANGEYIAFIPDDSRVLEKGLEEAIDFLKTKNKNDGMALVYSEGPNWTGTQHIELSYWTMGFHRLHENRPDIKPEYVMAPCFLINREFYIEIGGLDCENYYHVNMNAHDLAIRIQKNGGHFYLSPSRVFAANWDANFAQSILYKAYLEKDMPSFNYQWSGEGTNRYKIDFNNWKKSEVYWKLRYNTE